MQLPDRMSCHVETHGNGIHLIVSGRLDENTSGDFSLSVRSVLTGRPDVLVLDLTTVEFLSPEGTTAIVDAVLRAGESRTNVVSCPALRCGSGSTRSG
ncbi:STAS domain-containing protein [Phytohabitans kaempferiae]|uniref:STAS domain-containing protein n=1 Tax=Phytohabitans kaempferiae TaxID=1620943 RepID=A0ABV6MFY1_9ACTN